MTTKPNKPLLFQNDLDQACYLNYKNSRYLAVDTETLGLQVARDRLCLVQMCDENGLTSLIQIKNQSAPLLKELFESSSIEKIFHYGRFDLATLKHWLGIEVTPVFCTKIASRLVRTYTSHHGLKDLTRELTGIELDKQQQSSDWASDTLSAKQIEYAASDVIYLIDIKQKLETMLKRDGRWHLAKTCMDFLATRVDLDLAGWENEDIFSHS